MTRGGGLLAATAAIAVVAACSSFGDGATPSDEPAEAGAAGVDASSPVATDASVDAGATRACPPEAAFCDDFESNSLVDWSVEPLRGTVTIGIDEGNHVLLAHGASGTAGPIQALAKRAFPGVYPGTVAVRARLKTPTAQAAALAGNLHVLKVEELDPADPTVTFLSHAVVMLPQSWRIETFTPSAAFATWDPAPLAPPALTAWSCVELDVTLAQPGHVILFVDGARIVDKDATTIDQANLVDGGVGNLTITTGFVTGESLTADQDVLVDDVAVTTSSDVTLRTTPRLGCP